MEAITELNGLPAPFAVEALPAELSDWPEPAVREYNRLLRELNSWSRDNDWPMSGNPWIAEEAVRRSW